MSEKWDLSVGEVAYAYGITNAMLLLVATYCLEKKRKNNHELYLSQYAFVRVRDRAIQTIEKLKMLSSVFTTKYFFCSTDMALLPLLIVPTFLFLHTLLLHTLFGYLNRILIKSLLTDFIFLNYFLQIIPQ